MSIHWNSIVKAAGVAVIIASASALAVGQGAQPAAQGRGRGGAPADTTPAGPVPRLSNGKPDLSGHWANPYTPNMGNKGTVLDPKTRQPLVFPRLGEPLKDARESATGGGGRTFDLPFTERGLKEWIEYDVVKNGDYAGSCLPFGMSAEYQLAPRVADRPPRGFAGVPVRAEHLVSLGADQRHEVARGPAGKLERPVNRPLGRATRW